MREVLLPSPVTEGRHLDHALLSQLGFPAKCSLTLEYEERAVWEGSRVTPQPGSVWELLELQKLLCAGGKLALGAASLSPAAGLGQGVPLQSWAHLPNLAAL